MSTITAADPRQHPSTADRGWIGPWDILNIDTPQPANAGTLTWTIDLAHGERETIGTVTERPGPNLRPILTLPDGRRYLALSVTGAAQAAYAARMHGIDPATRGGIVDLAPIIAAHRPQRRAVRDL